MIWLLRCGELNMTILGVHCISTARFPKNFSNVWLHRSCLRLSFDRSVSRSRTHRIVVIEQHAASSTKDELQRSISANAKLRQI